MNCREKSQRKHFKDHVQQSVQEDEYDENLCVVHLESQRSIKLRYKNETTKPDLKSLNIVDVKHT